MRKFLIWIFVLVLFAACDLQPKISSLPDTVGDFISARYPALLADPNTESEIYNSAARDYGVYASPELYGSVDVGDYVNYAGADDYVLREESDNTGNAEITDGIVNEVDDEIVVPEKVNEHDDADASQENDKPEFNDISADTEKVTEVDVIDIPEYKTQELNVPARAASGTVVVRRGDTLYAIARDNKMTLAEIAQLNNLAAPYTIRIGQVLKIKSENPVVKSAVKDVPQVDTPKTVAKTEIKPEPKIKEKKSDVKPDVKKDSKPKQEQNVSDAKQKSIKEPSKKVEPKVQKDIRVPIKEIRVARGDTLYSISRQYSVPVNDLAVMNKLSAPFALSAGQVLRVPDLQVRKNETSKATLQMPKNDNKKVEDKKTTAVKTVKTQADKKTASQKATQKKTETKKQDVKKNNKTETVKKAETTNKTEIKKAQQTDVPKIVARSSSKFSWPLRGTILSHYGAKTGGLYNDGINISAALNTSVFAAENGIVAYAGNEVRGMGNLVIIQHADGWMTVYAHLNSMTVRRGARVSVGQKIGAVGKTGKVTTPQLHFEIRKGTKAYNPINYLKK